MALAAGLVAIGLVTLQSAPPVRAAEPDAGQSYLDSAQGTETLPVYRADFRAGNLISDGNFYNGSALSEGEVQAFLDDQVPACKAGFTCLKSFVQSTANEAADVVCGAYDGAENEPSARIITKVGRACGISQQVLLVLLEKEQGLVSDTWPIKDQYDRAVGYKCPGDKPCDPKYFGFFQQVYNAAWQFKFYSSPANSTLTYFPVGESSDIRYSSDESLRCDRPAVTIRNKATAALYYYTPYQPNAPALANFFTEGDECSEYGNRNFWAIYNGWFGSSIVDRSAGPDRFAASAAISRANFAPGAPVVYVANGFKFPDALSGAPVAGMNKAPVLLVNSDVIPAPIATELSRLRPGKIVILGGSVSVSMAVESALKPFVRTPTSGDSITRLAGADRFEASAAISAASFPADVQVVYVANGLNFPDALSGAPVAGANGAPVLLVTADGIPAPIATELTRLKPGKIVILGGPASVSMAVESALAPFIRTTISADSVTRLTGADRFEASATISKANFAAKVPVVYVSNGSKFPDALSGAPVAGMNKAPVLLVTSDGVPASIATELARLKPARIVVLGGAASVSEAVTTQLSRYIL